jgi:hypothetical protein
MNQPAITSSLESDLDRYKVGCRRPAATYSTSLAFVTNGVSQSAD